VGNAAMSVIGLLWLFGTGLFVPLLLGRRDSQDKRPTQFEHMRATSVYRPIESVPRAHRLVQQ
jgi:hypothetical protein